MTGSQSGKLTWTKHRTVCPRCSTVLHTIQDKPCPCCGEYVKIPKRIKRRIKRDKEG